MAVVGRVNFPQIASIERDLISKMERDVLRVLRIAGEECVNEAKRSGSYQDRTANLRNSAGYVILVDGSTKEQNFQSGEGGQHAENLARQIAAEYPKGYVLIVVSGMNYAAYVESKGYNVLTSAEQIAETLLPTLLNRI